MLARAVRKSTAAPFPGARAPVTCEPRCRACGLAIEASQEVYMCRVLNKHAAGVPAGAVYIGRGSKWGNPFRIGVDGDRAAVIAKYECWLRNQHHLLRGLDELRGHDLLCFCAPKACHGDLLLRLANASREERIAWWRSDGHDRHRPVLSNGPQSTLGRRYVS